MTWTRAYLKENAKQVLKWSYWNALLVCFLAELLGGAAGGGGGSASFHYSSGTSGTGGGELPAEIIVLMVVIIVVLLLAVAALQVFVTNPVQVGKRRYFIANRQRRGETGQLFSLFRKGNVPQRGKGNVSAGFVYLPLVAAVCCARSDQRV